MLQRSVAILLLFALLSSNFSRFFVYAGFEMNKKQIISTLCENRNRPWLHCNGKCYLLKKLRQSEEREKSEERQSQKSLLQESFFDAGTAFKCHTFLIATIQTPYISPATIAAYCTVFRPPQIA